jgi:beta-lactamase regulating signal transducer with metallopeptidase domain
LFATTESNATNLNPETIASTRIPEQPPLHGLELEQAGLIANKPATSSPAELSAANSLAADPLETTTTNTFSLWKVAALTLALSHVLAFGLFIIEWLVGTHRLQRICRVAQPADASIGDTWTQVAGARGGSVRLLVSGQISAPLVFGSWRPVILIPESLAEGDRSALRFCLAHEWSHVIGGDLRAWQFANLCQFLLWYQPLFWTLRRELRICQDLVADDRAVGDGSEVENRLQYSEILMSIAKQKLNPNIVGAIAFHDRSSQLARRIQMLLSSRPAFRLRSSQTFLWLSAGVVLVTSLLVGSVRLNAARAEMKPAEQSAIARVDDTINKSEDLTTSQNADDFRPTEDFRIVKGRVTNEQGQPIPSVQLWLPLEFYTTNVVSGRSDRDGNFALRCPREWIKPNIWRSGFYLWAHAPGYNIQMLNVYKSLREGTDEDYSIQLLPESETRYRLIRPAGEPIEGLRVYTAICRDEDQPFSVPEEMRAIVSGVTDADGWVTLRAVPEEKIDTIEIECAEFGRQQQRRYRQPDFRLDSIQMRPTAAVQGRIISENPAWVAGIRLMFLTTVDEEWKNTSGHAEVITDAEGRFEIPQIAVGKSTRIYVHPDQNLPVRPQLPDDLKLTAGEISSIEIPLVAAPLVSGTVLSKNQTPILNADITLFYGGESRQSDHIVTDEHGRYEGRVLPGEFSVLLFAIPRGHARPSGSRPSYTISADTKSFEVPPIELLGTSTIVGHLIDEHDQPLSKKRIDALEGYSRHGVGLSDADGRFEIAVPEGTESGVTLSLQEQGFGERLAVVQRTPLIVRYVENKQNDKHDTERAAKADVTLSGRVLLEGEPVVGAAILLKRRVKTVYDESSKGYLTPYSQVDAGVTDEKGNYRLTGLKAGDGYAIEVRPKFAAADLTWQHQMPHQPTVPEDAPIDVTLPDVNLCLLNQSISGVVVDLEDKPVKGVRVNAELKSGERLTYGWIHSTRPWTTTDHLGRFEIKDLPDRPLTIVATINNSNGGRIHVPVRLDVERNQQDIQVVLASSAIGD